MKALVLRAFGKPDELKFEELPEPTPKADQILIDVRAASVNFSDLLVIAGKYQKLPDLPCVPGKECAGVVKSVGKDIASIRIGDRVMTQVEEGAFAEAVVAKERDCHLIPASMEFSVAAALGTAYTTAYFALLERAQLNAGETVLVTGASGGVGLAAVQIAKAHGATVLAAVSSHEKAQAAKASGADFIVDVSAADLRKSFRDQVFAEVGDRGVDVIVDNVGGDVFDAALRALAWCGRMVVVGFTSGRIPEIKTGVVLVKNISVIGLHISDYRIRQPERVRTVTQGLIDMCVTGKIKPHIMATFPLEQYQQSLALLSSRRAIGKVLLMPTVG